MYNGAQISDLNTVSVVINEGHKYSGVVVFV